LTIGPIKIHEKTGPLPVLSALPVPVKRARISACFGPIPEGRTTMRLRLPLVLAVLGLLVGSPLLAQSSKGKKTPKKKVASTQGTVKAAVPTPTPTAPSSQAMPEPTREGVKTEAQVQDLDGTIMVQHPDQAAGTALQTGSTVEKGDDLKVYEGSWVILKTHRGDRIGLSAGTEVSVDEMYFEGPDRQIRLVLRKGSLFLRTNDSSSRQSFFEIQAGNQVLSIGDCEARLDLDPQTQRMRIQYLKGKVRVIDQEKETKFSTEHTEQFWDSGRKTEGEGAVLDEVAVLNFRRFFDGKPPVETPDTNPVLPERDAREKLPSKR
jgi:hypothetical protein